MLAPPSLPSMRFFGSVGIDPEGVAVAVRRAHGPEGLTAVVGFPHRRVEGVDRVGIGGIGLDVGVVPGPLAELAVGVHPAELGAAVVGAEETALVVLDECPDPFGEGRRDRHRDAVPDRPWEGPWLSFNQVLPPSMALVETAVGTTGDHGPGSSLRLPDRRVEDPRVARVHGEIHGAGSVRHKEHLRPAETAIGRPVDAALFTRAEDVSQDGDIDDIRRPSGER